MTKNSIHKVNLIFFILFTGILLLYSCGTPMQLTGGPKDVDPPKVLKMTPKDLSTNFKAQKVTIEFNEFFKLQDQNKEFSVSPDMERTPELKIKKKRLEITFQDSLEKNTTYTLNFGKSIADVNESNVLKNFTYVFSTGPKLDSLSISGRITDALTGLPILDAVAMIFPLAKDSLFGKKKPSIYLLTDSSGRYKLSNLKAGTYKIYALKEQNGDRIYQQNTEEVGFIKDSVVLNKNIDSANLVVFKENNTVFRVNDRKLNADGSIFMSFNQQLKNPEIKVVDPPELNESKKMRISKTKDSVKIWLNKLDFDSTKISITDQGKLLQTVKFTRGKKDTYKRNVLPTDNLEGNLLNPNKAFKLTFDLPIESVDMDKITFMEDSVQKTNFTIVKDSIDFLSYSIKYPWVPKSKYNIKFGAGAFTGIFDAKNKEFSKNFELASKDDYGTLKVKINTPEPDKNYILEVVNEQKNVVTSLIVKTDTTANFVNYKAGKYFIRIIYDSNKNDVWDTGNISEGLQPEKIYNNPKELSIRANWERNETIDIPKEQTITGTNPST